MFDKIKSWFKNPLGIERIEENPKQPIPQKPIETPKKIEFLPSDFSPIDKAQNYYNFVLQNKNIVAKKWRLGQYSTAGEPVRKKNLYPKDSVHLYPAPLVGVLHVPVANILDKNKKDITAELTAKYLAGREASVHVCSDRDSYILCLPFDSVGWHCANSNTHQFSIGIEMGGLGEGKDSYNGIKGDAYWSTDDAILKYRQVAKGVIEGTRLLYGEKWEQYLIPLQKAELNSSGGIVKAGWTQHREIPIWSKTLQAYNQNNSAGKNQVRGQHTDVCADFPWELFFKVFEEEISNAKQETL